MFESLGKAIRKLIDRKLRNTAVAIPGKVLSYDAASKTAKVQPAIYRAIPNAADEDTDSFEEMPAIPGVPVMWPRARGFVLEGTLGAGDSVLLVACDRDISVWRRSGGLSAPSDGREHHWANAVALPGLIPSTNPFTTPSDAAALASKVDKIIHLLKGWTFVAMDGGAALQTAAALTFPGYPGSPGSLPTPEPILASSTASTILKLGS